MSDFGITPTGFIRKRAADIRESMEGYIQSPAGMGAGTPVRDSPLEEIIGVIAVELGSVWEAAEAAYNAFDPDFATGYALDNLLELVGDSRRGPKKSTGEVTILGTSGTFVPSGFEVKDSDTDARFVTTENVTLPGNALVESVEFGPISATIDTTVTVIAGVSGVTQVGNISRGRFEETDPEARARRRQSFQTLGRGTLLAIEAALTSGTKALSARVYEYPVENPPAGHKPFSIEPLLYIPGHGAADEEDIARILWEHASGIEFVGTENKTVHDSRGASHQVAWSWVQDVAVQVQAFVFIDDPSLYYPDGTQKIKDAIYSYINGLDVGADVSFLQLTSKATVDGLINLHIYTQQGASGWVGSGISVDVDEIATISYDDITVYEA